MQLKQASHILLFTIFDTLYMFMPLMTQDILPLQRAPRLAQTPAVPRSLSSPASLAALRLCSADWPLLLACIGTEFCGGRLITTRAARHSRVQAKRLLTRRRQERPRSNRTSAASAKPLNSLDNKIGQVFTWHFSVT